MHNNAIDWVTSYTVQQSSEMLCQGLPYNHMPIKHVLYLLHQPASSWEVSQKLQKTSIKEAVSQQIKPRTPSTWCVTTKLHTTSRKSGAENSLYRVVWLVEHASCLQSVSWTFLCVCLDCHKICNPAFIILGTLTPMEMN